MFNIAVFVSGRGSNLKAILNEIELGNLSAKILSVVSNDKNCGAIQFANDKDIPTYIVANKGDDNSDTYSNLIQIFSELEINLVVLAGFLKKIPNEFISSFRNKIINIHPALLPKFGGKGMYGANVHKSVFESKEKISGATVHFVDEIYDNGKIIAQKTVDISDVKTPTEIAERVLKIEHKLLPEVIKKIQMEMLV